MQLLEDHNDWSLLQGDLEIYWPATATAIACTMHMLSDVALLDCADGMLVLTFMPFAHRDGALHMPRPAQCVRRHSVRLGGQHHPAVGLCACPSALG